MALVLLLSGLNLIPVVTVYALTIVSTEPLSNAAAVVFAASQSFLSPIGYQTNLMVFSPGNYRFLDFLRFGWQLTLIYVLVVPAVILQVLGPG